MRKKTILFCLLIILAFTSPALGTSYYGYSDWGGTWHDVNKTWVGDWNLCWAASASNVLAWARYGTATFTNDTQIFNDFKAHWSDLGSLQKYGWAWYLNGTLPPNWPGWSQVIAPGGDNNWPGVPFASVYHENWNSAQSMSAIDQFLHAGYGAGLAIYDGGHAITVWGYEYDNTGYKGVYVTDSDDNVTNLAYYPVSWDSINNWWDLGGGYSGWAIKGVAALSPNPIPEPGTLLLLGSGLLGLVGYGRKKFFKK